MRLILFLCILFFLPLAGCTDFLLQKQTHGYVLTPELLKQVSVGASREQVLLALGTPSTESVENDRESFYYVSQEIERYSFMKPEIVDQRILAIYFDKEQYVEKIADYGLKDGKVFDYYREKTLTSGKEASFLGQLLSGIGRF